ncbi:transposase [Zooshikella marina]|uniref:transposase n=1 Tax=Zooshikella ganghwensis TaxID=202772 RepID=UPI001BAE78E4|nr:transposase [Zooshikella ganghwensis]MBU2708459.1 transposase [Zooshikella ganghwensis]
MARCSCFGAYKSETYYGFKGHLLIDFHGAIAGFTLTPANDSEREAVWKLTKLMKSGILLGDKGYLGADFKAELFATEPFCVIN